MSKLINANLIDVIKTQIGQDEVNSVNSRELYELLEVNEKYSDWINRAIEKYDFIEKYDYICFSEKSEKGGRPRRDYIVTLDMAKELCMVSNTTKGKQVRRYFIEVEKQANKPLTVEQLLLENAKVIKQLQDKNISLEYKIKEDEHKVIFSNSVKESNTSILIGEFAKAISTDTFKVGQNRLFEWLRQNSYLISSGTRKNQPMQQYIDNGYFEVIERIVNNPDGTTRTTLTPKITGKGQVSLTKKIQEAFNKLNEVL